MLILIHVSWREIFLAKKVSHAEKNSSKDSLGKVTWSREEINYVNYMKHNKSLILIMRNTNPLAKIIKHFDLIMS